MIPDTRGPTVSDFPRSQQDAARVGYTLACGDETVATVTLTNVNGRIAWQITYRNTNPRTR